LSHLPRERTWLPTRAAGPAAAEGWLSSETLATIAAHLRVPKSEVWGVASPYPQLRLPKPGRRVVRVCAAVACIARGGERLLGAASGGSGSAAGETTRDAR